tara:strand:- start:76 stop:798 length:723 start_codon:yes stop_codon:yes gene_type:complete
MGYFRELPDIFYQSPLSHKKSSIDYVAIKNIFRRTKLFDYLSDNVSFFNKYVIEDGDRPDTVAESLYGDSELDYIVILVAGITNINHEWPIQDFQIYDFALAKYGSEQKMNEIHHYETYEIKDSENRQILPPNLIVDDTFKLDGSALRHGTNRFTVINQSGNLQLDDKNQYTVATDNIARPVTFLDYEIDENEKRREIDVLRPSYVPNFISDLRDVTRYSKNSRYISGSIISTEPTNLIP